MLKYLCFISHSMLLMILFQLFWLIRYKRFFLIICKNLKGHRLKNVVPQTQPFRIKYWFINNRFHGTGWEKNHYRWCIMTFCTEAWNKGTEHGLGGEKFTKTEKCVVPKISCEENAHKFSDTDSIVHWEFHPEGWTITAAHYTHIMEWLLIWRNWEGPALYWSKGWFLLHRNVPSHNAATVKHILATRKVAVLHTPP